MASDINVILDPSSAMERGSTDASQLARKEAKLDQLHMDIQQLGPACRKTLSCTFLPLNGSIIAQFLASVNYICLSEFIGTTKRHERGELQPLWRTCSALLVAKAIITDFFKGTAAGDKSSAREV